MSMLSPKDIEFVRSLLVKCPAAIDTELAKRLLDTLDALRSENTSLKEDVDCLKTELSEARRIG